MQTKVSRNGKPVDIRIVPFPDGVRSVRGICQEDSDCYYILVREDLTPSERASSLGHELAHIFLGHLDAGRSYSREMETEANLHAAHFYQLYERGEL